MIKNKISKKNDLNIKVNERGMAPQSVCNKISTNLNFNVSYGQE